MNPHLLNRFIDLFEKREEKYTVVNSSLFYNYNGIIMPFAPANEHIKLNDEQATKIIYRLNGKLARWTVGDFSYEEFPEWYALICKNFTNIHLVRSKLRNELKKGLSNCRIEQIDANYLSRNGYKIYYKALERYSNFKPKPTEEKNFKKHINSGKDFDDILQYWGVFFNEHLIGYSSNYIFNKTEALYSSIKINPAFLSYYPSYALIYSMNKTYLDDYKFEYVNDGYRSLMHGTNIQDFLIRKFNFFKAGLSLRITYRPFYGALVKTIYPFRKILSGCDARLDALLELERIRRNYA